MSDKRAPHPFDGPELVDLGCGGTPLLPLRSEFLNEKGCDAWIKNEALNPTGSFKDRLNTVSVAMARRFGYTKVLCSSTGNHAVSLAALAAAADLECVVFCSSGVPDTAVYELAHYGAQPVVLPDGGETALIAELVREDGWFPSMRNAIQPPGRTVANPYGLEGYKSIAFEIVASFGGRVPDWVIPPTCGGDGLYGIWRGFEILASSGLIPHPPKLVAVQPAAAASLVNAVTDGATTVSPVVPQPSAALSIVDPRAGEHALEAVRGSGGLAVAVSEGAIRDAVTELGRQGMCVEPASAAPLAALKLLVAYGKITAGERAVCVATGTGLRWPLTFTGDDGETDVESLKMILPSNAEAFRRTYSARSRT